MDTPISPFAAFLTAQKQFSTALKDTSNSFFRSKYADLHSIWSAVKDALHTNGLYVTQPIKITESGGAMVVTTVRYQDGTIVETSECPVVCKVANDPQAMGSAITYARRYSLAAILCVMTDDDDAEGAMSRDAPQANKTDDSRAQYKTPPMNWQALIDATGDANGLNTVKKQIGTAKLEPAEFTRIWNLLTARGKVLGSTYNKETKQFS